MMFKRKYTRSEWMFGLLAAELMRNEGYGFDEILQEFYFDSDDVREGAYDYCWFKEHVRGKEIK
jgi:hypothetical protein